MFTSLCSALDWTKLLSSVDRNLGSKEVWIRSEYKHETWIMPFIWCPDFVPTMNKTSQKSSWKCSPASSLIQLLYILLIFPFYSWKGKRSELKPKSENGCLLVTKYNRERDPNEERMDGECVRGLRETETIRLLHSHCQYSDPSSSLFGDQRHRLLPFFKIYEWHEREWFCFHFKRRERALGNCFCPFVPSTNLHQELMKGTKYVLLFPSSTFSLLDPFFPFSPSHKPITSE